MNEFQKFIDNEKKALKKVIASWGIVEFILFIIFIPWSVFYLLFRMFQELE